MQFHTTNESTTRSVQGLNEALPQVVVCDDETANSMLQTKSRDLQAAVEPRVHGTKQNSQKHPQASKIEMESHSPVA